MSEAFAIGGLALMMSGIECQPRWVRLLQAFGGVVWVVSGLR